MHIALRQSIGRNGIKPSSRRVNDDAIAGDVARFLFLISTMNGRVESFMSARRGERWTSPANSARAGRCMISWIVLRGTCGLHLRRRRPCYPHGSADLP